MGEVINALIGVNTTGYKKVHGGVGYGDKNSQGEEILEQAANNDLAIVNNFFYKSRERTASNMVINAY